MSFEKDIKEKLGPHKVEEVIKNNENKNNFLIQIQELILDKIFTLNKLTEDHKNTLEKYTSLIHLTLNLVGLESLENFPKLEEAQIVSKPINYFNYQIELNENKLKGDDLEILLKNCPKLYKIKLEKNLIDNIDNLKCLANYNIKKINVQGNPIAQAENYRDTLFNMVPSLMSIDGIDREGNEVESTLYGEEDEEADDLDYEEGEGEEEGDLSEEDEEGEDNGEEDDEDDDDDEKPHKKSKE